ncbi:hypothetical protein PIB30_091305 [Stylosanthes scabra]|uniref:Uncharacterized protein n=1 Tax=Stylosanthes scabra TaxID=79078 RepID=A0ABU6QTY6_9FABA|nr:hypothetical protein [Stylosanthes scabra]
MRPIVPFSPHPAASPSSSTSSSSTGSVHRERERSPRTPLQPMAPAPARGPGVAPPTPPSPSPPPSDDEPSVETYDPATELVGDPDEPYVAEHVPYGALRTIIRTLLTDWSVRVPVPTLHLPAITLLVVLPAVSPWAMGLPRAGQPMTVHQRMIW